MYGELITVGDELLSGLVVNSNAARIAHDLGLAGFRLRWTTVVGDREEDITDALTHAMGRAAFILVTGGLGPTDDDRTSVAAARALGRPVGRDPLSWEVLNNHLKKLNLSMTPGIAKMADLPEGAKRIDLVGPRAGFYLEDSGTPLFFLPGIPEEMTDMMASFVLPTLKKQFPGRAELRSRLLRTLGLRESEINYRLANLETKYPDLNFGYLPRFPENHLTLTVQAATAAAAESLLEEVAQEVARRLGLYVYGQGNDSLEKVVGRLLLEKGHTLALAESCTGGLIAHRITNSPGSSAYFDRAIVTYSDTAKVVHLFVSPKIIARHGVVSLQVAEAMVRGLQEQTKATMALAVTGVAGPSGGTPEIPVGTVFLALLCNGALRIEGFQFRVERLKVKGAAAATALDWLRRAMIDDSFFPGGPQRDA
ncbi:MAG: CinA family nicotinamide mononucleotide deamidase-related protein [Deltaproteobacteria bacterium]|nr:MAG: CinA family nicotinamide mononucleotide deamidase-related protein [Deltaproteobacteria bacterium]